jgi:ketosteroid isomerase-like protein
LACVGVLITLAACGRADEGKVRSAVDDYISARAAGDAAEICSLYTEEFRVQQGLAKNCPAKLAVQLQAEPQPTETTIAEVKVHENLARVDLDVSAGGAPSRVTLGLIDKDGRWLIAAST